MECSSTAYTTTPGTATTVPSQGGSWTHDEPCHAQCSVHSKYNIQSDRREIGPFNRATLILVQFVFSTSRTLGRRATAANSSLEMGSLVAPAISMRVTSWNPRVPLCRISTSKAAIMPALCRRYRGSPGRPRCPT